MPLTESKKRANQKYIESHIIRFPLNLNIGTDTDVIDRLSKQESKNGYIKQLIRDDIKRNPD